MIAAEKIAVPTASKISARSPSETGLVVDRTDITFHDLSRDAVEIRVKVRNEGSQRSNPEIMRLQSAPFGVFVPWRPLAELSVPPLEPGESRELSVKATRFHPKPLGDFNAVAPMRMLTVAEAAPDERAAPSRISNLQEMARRQVMLRSNSNPWKNFLPADLWEYVGREQPHWAGNIDVFIGHRAVERHFAKSLRIFAGRSNLAFFKVGGSSPRDAYSFRLVGDPDWKATLYDQSHRQTLVTGTSDAAIQENQWVESPIGMMLVILAVRPPVVCENANIQVHVTRRSTQETAIVEFDLDPTAQGPGCYAA